MHELLPMEQASDGWDIVFYGYESTRARALSSANMLRQFIDDFATSRRERSGEQSYRDVLVVAHSLGALIARQCVLDALRERLPWASRTRLLLFGPAHRGASVVALGKELLAGVGSWGAAAAALFNYRAPALQDLDPASAFVRKLAEDTQIALRVRKKPPLVADRVLWGQFDKVVQVENFCLDPASFAVANQGHVKVCKPTAQYIVPLQEVVNHL